MRRSIKQHMPGSKVILCLVERYASKELLDDLDFDEVVLAKELGFENFDQTIFKYNQYEAVCACKAKLLIYLYGKYVDERYVIYLDADTQVFSQFSEVEQAFNKYSIVLTPHYLVPPKEEYMINGEHAEMNLLRVGVINAGFVGVKRSPESEKFLTWWNSRLERYAFLNSENGFYADQRWLTLAMALFDEVHLLKHPGYNIAFWNLDQREITFQRNRCLANDEPVRFIHFSRTDLLLETVKKDVAMSKIVHQYISELNENDGVFPANVEWSYSFFDNGERVMEVTRAYFNQNPDEIDAPFALNNRIIQHLTKTKSHRYRLYKRYRRSKKKS